MNTFTDLTEIYTDVDRRGREKRIAFYQLIISNIKRVYNEFRTNEYPELLFLAQHNYQVESFEHLLRTLVHDSIRISQGEWTDNIYMATDEQVLYPGDKVFMFVSDSLIIPEDEKVFFTNNNSDNVNVDYYINIDAAAYTTENISKIDKYALQYSAVGMKYIIKTI